MVGVRGAGVGVGLRMGRERGWVLSNVLVPTYVKKDCKTNKDMAIVACNHTRIIFDHVGAASQFRT